MFCIAVIQYRGKQYDTDEHQKEVLERQKMRLESSHRRIYRGVRIGPRYSHENPTL